MKATYRHKNSVSLSKLQLFLHLPVMSTHMNLLDRSLQAEFPEPAYQEYILFQNYKRRLDLPGTILLRSVFPHNSERTMIANCIFFYFCFNLTS